MENKISFGMKAKKKSPVKLSIKKLGSHAFNATILAGDNKHVHDSLGSNCSG